MTPYDPLSNIARTWREVDFDRYHYLVMNIVERTCPVAVIINHIDLHIAYTTGIRAVDLSLYEDLRGKQPLESRMQFLNTAGQVKIDWFKFMSELTKEERKGLIPPGYILRPENLEHNPTQGLDTVTK